MREFHELFAGREDVYGTVDLSPAPTPGVKREGEYQTVSGPVTKELYQNHLLGEQSLGIVPIMEDNKCWFFAIDVDDYEPGENIHVKLARKIRLLGLPLLVCSTKSGGVHMYCFLKKPMSAKIARAKAYEFIRVLGLPEKTEVFPRHDEGGKSWINLPYFGGDRQYMGVDGETPLSLREFLIAADHAGVWPDEFDRRQEAEEILEEEDHSRGDEEAPPCVQRMLAQGVEEGGRDNALTQISIYLAASHPDTMQERLQQINANIISPPLPLKKVSTLYDRFSVGKHGYMCDAQPMNTLCDKQACLKRKFGIGTRSVQEGQQDLNFRIDSVRVTGDVDPVYTLMVNGVELSLKVDQFMNYNAFKKAVFIKMGFMVSKLKQTEWEQMINLLMENADREEAPEATDPTQQLILAFKDWVQENMENNGNDIEDLNAGSPYYDWDHSVVVFRPDDFFIWFRRRYFEKVDRPSAFATFRRNGVQQRGNTWAFPAKTPWFELKRPTTI